LYGRVLKYSDHPKPGFAGRPSANAVNRIGGIIAEALLAFPLFWLLDTREFSFALLGYLLMMTAFAANYGLTVPRFHVQQEFC
jgi:hypothetical protein